MDKKLFSIIIFAGIFGLAGFAFAVGLPDLGPSSFNALITGIIGAVAEVVGGLSTIMFIVSGILFLTSGGNPGRMQTAKTALFYAIIGIVICLSASAITAFVKSVVS